MFYCFRLVFVLIMMFVMTQMSCAQNDGNCDSLFKKLFRQEALKPGQMSSMEYGVKLIERNSSKLPVENKTKILWDNSHRYVLTEHVQVYIDTMHTISMSPISKTIMILNTNQKVKEGLQKNAPSGLGEDVDSLLNSMFSVASCSDVKGKELYDKVIVLKSKHKEMSLTEVDYFVQSKKDFLYKVSMLYSSGAYTSAEYTYYKSSQGQSNEKIDRPVYGLFFNKEGALLPNFKGYKVHDSRNRKINNTKK